MQDIPMMHISVPRHHILLSRQQGRCHGGSDTQDTAVRPTHRGQRIKPARERKQCRGRLCPVRMELRQHCTNRATGLFIPAVASPIDQAKSLVGAFHENRIIAVREHARRALSTPPVHQPPTAPLLAEDRDLEHGGHAGQAHWEQAAGGRDDGFAVRR
jgi:hypothetical protein